MRLAAKNKRLAAMHNESTEQLRLARQANGPDSHASARLRGGGRAVV
jgi:hypothetical protein